MEIDSFKENSHLLVSSDVILPWSSGVFALGQSRVYEETNFIFGQESKTYRLTEYYHCVKTNTPMNHTLNVKYTINEFNNEGFVALYGMTFYNPMSHPVPYLENMDQEDFLRIKKDFCQKFMYFMSKRFGAFFVPRMYRFVLDAFSWYVNEEDWNDFCLMNKINVDECGLIRFFITMNRAKGKIPAYYTYCLTKK